MPTPPQSNYDDLVNNQLAQDWTDGKAFVDALLQFMQDEFKSIFGTTNSSARQGSMPGLYGSFSTYTFEDAATVVTTFLQFCDDIAETVLKIVIQALEDLTLVLTTSFKIVSPTSLLGLLLNDVLHIDPTLSIAEIIGMIIGFPATLVGKILGKGDTLPALPTMPTSDSEAALAEAVDMDPTVKLWLGILGGTTQAIWGFADIIGDLQTLAGEDGKRGTQSGVIDMFDIWCPMFETFFLFPYDPVDGAIQWAIPPMVLTALLPSIMGVLALFEWPGITSKLISAGIDDSIVNAMAEYVGPFVQAFSGAANTAIGITFQVKTGDTNWVDLAGTALGNLSFLLAVFGTLWLNASTEDVPVIIKMVVDAVGNIGAAVCIYESTSLPPTR
jgi:hypothetical protein